jgi:formate/nitrite transporter
MRPTDETSGGVSQLDALLAPEMARRAEHVGVQKAGMDAITAFTLAVLAGAFIALGGVFATTALAGAGSAPWGAIRVLAGVAFSVGLVLVVVGGAELFTGNNLIVMAWASRRVSTWALLRNWLIVFAGNFVGAVGTAGLVYVAGTHRGGSGAFGATALAIAHTKVQLGFTQAIALGVLCNTLVCLAVWLTLSAPRVGAGAHQALAAATTLRVAAVQSSARCAPPRLLGHSSTTELAYATQRSIQRSQSCTLDGAARKMTAAP